MNKRAINKAIAEFLGWKELDFHLDGKRILGDRPTFSNGKIISYTVDQYVPDYCNDLNLIHEAEKVLTSEQVTSYVYSLELMNERWATPAFATAAQRAKAFVETIGKWKE